MPPATSEIRHCHARALQFFHVLAGELSVALPGQTHTLRAEQGMEVAPGMPHRVFNDSAVEARFLVISSPTAQGDRVACPEESGGSGCAAIVLMRHPLAQVKIARMRGQPGTEVMAGLVARIDEMNQLGERSQGFVWRLPGSQATPDTLRVFADYFVPSEPEHLFYNLSVWESVECAVCRAGHDCVHHVQ